MHRNWYSGYKLSSFKNVQIQKRKRVYGWKSSKWYINQFSGKEWHENIARKALSLSKATFKWKTKIYWRNWRTFHTLRLTISTSDLTMCESFSALLMNSNWDCCGNIFSTTSFQNTSSKVFSNNTQTTAIATFLFFAPEQWETWP